MKGWPAAAIAPLPARLPKCHGEFVDGVTTTNGARAPQGKRALHATARNSRGHFHDRRFCPSRHVAVCLVAGHGTRTGEAAVSAEPAQRAYRRLAAVDGRNSDRRRRRQHLSHHDRLAGGDGDRRADRHLDGQLPSDRGSLRAADLDGAIHAGGGAHPAFHSLGGHRRRAENSDPVHRDVFFSRR